MSQLFIGAAGAAISTLLYMSHRQQNEESRLTVLREFQREFWRDPDMACVRSWIACDDSYRMIAPILMKRLESDGQLTANEYATLERIDKFAASLLGYLWTTARFRGQHRDATRRIFFEYWIAQATTEKRSALHAYLEKFYGELISLPGPR
ncbi:hypothetical protein [Nocardia sp. NPDC004711]